MQSEQFAHGTAGAGMFTYTRLLPTDVSFGNISDSEKTCQPINVTGYFATTHSAPVHNPSGTSTIPPPPASELNAYKWIQVREDNIELGTDWIGTGPLSGPSFGNGGSFTWNIPWVYKLTSDAYDTTVLGFPNPIVTTFRVTGNGTATVTKGGASDTRSPDGTENHSPGP
jgi:hypothetical protein